MKSYIGLYHGQVNMQPRAIPDTEILVVHFSLHAVAEQHMLLQFGLNNTSTVSEEMNRKLPSEEHNSTTFCPLYTNPK